MAASLAHDLARTEDWTPLLDEHLDRQSRSLFDKMTNTRTVLAETEEKRAQYIEENGLFSPFVAFGEEVSYRWNEQKAGGQKISLVKQAQERANEVISSANKSADELRTSSVTYATDVLKYVETNMENVLDSLKKNRQSLIDSNSAAARQQQEQQPQDEQKK